MSRAVAIVGADGDIALSVAHNLRKLGDVRTRTSGSGEDFLEDLTELPPDRLVLGLGPPGLDCLAGGRAGGGHPRFGDVPILILTARVQEAEKLLGFELGADDYVTKPFSVRELVARVRALLRRGAGAAAAAPIYQLGKVRIDCQQLRVFVGPQEVRLTRRELDLLRTLVEARGRVLSRDVLLTSVWGYDFPGETRTVDVHVRRLRRKLGAELVETVIGSG